MSLNINKPERTMYSVKLTTYSLKFFRTSFSRFAVAQWLRCCATNRKVAGSIPASVSRFFIDIKSLRSHYGPGVDSASNRNEYREYFLGVKSGRCLRLTTLPPSCAVVTKPGNLNFLEPSGPVKACNGTALPLPFIVQPPRLKNLKNAAHNKTKFIL